MGPFQGGFRVPDVFYREPASPMAVCWASIVIGTVELLDHNENSSVSQSTTTCPISMKYQ